MSDDFKDYLGDMNRAFAKLALGTNLFPKLKMPVFRPIAPTIKPSTITPEFGHFFKEINAQHAKIFDPFLQPEIGAVLRALPQKILEAVGQLASQCWYVSGSMTMPAMRRWGSLIEEQKFEEANESLCQYFESKLKEIEIQLKDKLPTRARILEAAFNAHLNGQYALSVPVFLAQADGVCQKRINASPFLRDRGTNAPKTAAWANNPGNDILNAFVYPLTVALPITYNNKERPQGFTGLNRHAILHGEDTSYDTQINSLKALSLLLYIENFVLSDLADNTENPEPPHIKYPSRLNPQIEPTSSLTC